MSKTIPISKLKANPTNPRVLRDDKFLKLKASIQSFPDMLNYRGIVAVTDTDGKFMVLGGNMRLRALQDLGIKEVPVMLADHWTEEQRREFIIKDNVGFGEWDWEQLANEWDGEQLQEWGLDLPVDFNAETNEGLTDPDEVPEVPETPVTVLGDVWVMGKHRIVCGDSTHADMVAKCLNGVKPHLMVTDPPYGIALDTDYSKMGTTKSKYKPIAGDDKPFDMKAVLAVAPAFTHACVWGGDYLLQSLPQGGSLTVWAKAHSEEENKVFGSAYEVLWIYPPTKREVWFIRRIHMTDEHIGAHPTQKPVECMKRPIENNSSPGQAVYEPFSGSGTTIIAGEMTGRSIHAIELSPAYVDVAVKRWQDFTGQKAIHEASGKTFEELSEAQASTV